MKIALLGTGFGRAHLMVFAERDNVEVVVFGRTPETLAKVEEQYGFATTTDLDSVYADASIDLVDICLPTPLHVEHVLRAMDAGKHVLTELPLSTEPAQARRVAEAAAHSDRQVFVDMYDRFSPTTALLLDAVRDGRYGPVLELEIWKHTALLWPGYDLGLDSIVWDMLHGDLDTLVQALGPPEASHTTAVAGVARGSAVQTVHTYPDAIARVGGSSLMPDGYGSRGGYRATFAGGILEFGWTADYTGRPDLPMVTEYFGKESRTTTVQGASPYAAMIDHVLACLHGKDTNRVTPTSVLDAVVLTAQIHRSVHR